MESVRQELIFDPLTQEVMADPGSTYGDFHDTVRGSHKEIFAAICAYCIDIWMNRGCETLPVRWG